MGSRIRGWVTSLYHGLVGSREGGARTSSPSREGGAGTGAPSRVSEDATTIPPPADPPAPPSDEELKGLSVLQLRERLKACEVPTQEVAACVEKQELVALLSTVLARQRNKQCAVCLTEGVAAVRMPCGCHRAEGTIAFCRRCIEIICEQSPNGVGRCPTCRKYIRIDRSTGEVCETTNHGECRMCRQQRAIVSEGICEACCLGRLHALRYICDRCHNVQRIPHPMWRYQEQPHLFGTDTWACHVRCGDYTHWRVVDEDAALIPDAECPESWGRRDAWLAGIRDQRHREIEQETHG